ncbi:hypothetical protein ES703_29268 [subsurface metagenome]
MSNNEKPVEVPIVQEEFANFLKKYRVVKGGEMCDTIAENIAETGGANVFEDPEILAKGLGTWSEYIGSPLRKQILQHWFAKKHIEVPSEALEIAGITSKTEAEAKKKKDTDKKVTEGTVWTVAVDDKGMPRIRMIKDTSEPGTTLEEAKEAAKEIGKDYAGEEALVTYNESLGKHMPNFKSDFVKQHPGAAWAVARQMDQAMVAGEPIDPMDAFIDQMAKIESMKELVGGGKEQPEAKASTITEIVSAVKSLKDMAGEGKELPSWMSDPVAFQKTIQELTPKGDTEALKELKEELTKLRDDQHQAELKRRDEQNAELVTVIQGYRGEVSKLRDEIEKNKMATGRTAYDLLGDLVQKVPDKDDVRAMVMEAVGKGPKLLPRGTGEREKVLEGMATNIEQAAEVKSFEDRWWRLG